MENETVITTGTTQFNLVEDNMCSMEASVPQSSLTTFVQSTEEDCTVNIAACTTTLIVKTQVCQDNLDVSTLSNSSECTSESSITNNCDSDKPTLDINIETLGSSDDNSCGETGGDRNVNFKSNNISNRSFDTILDDSSDEVDRLKESRGDESNVDVNFETVFLTYSNFLDRSNTERVETEINKNKIQKDGNHVDVNVETITLSSDSSDDSYKKTEVDNDNLSEISAKSYVDVNIETILLKPRSCFNNYSDFSFDDSEVDKDNLNKTQEEERNEEVNFETVFLTPSSFSNKSSDFSFDDNAFDLNKAQEEDNNKNFNFETVLLRSKSFSNRSIDDSEVQKDYSSTTQEDESNEDVNIKIVTPASSSSSFSNIHGHSVQTESDKYKLNESQSDYLKLDISIETQKFLDSRNDECFNENEIDKESLIKTKGACYNLEADIEIVTLTSDSSFESNVVYSVESKTDKYSLNKTQSKDSFTDRCISDGRSDSISVVILDDESDIEIVDTEGLSDWDPEELENEIRKEELSNLHIKKKRKIGNGSKLKTNCINIVDEDTFEHISKVSDHRDTSLNSTSFCTDAGSSSVDKLIAKRELNNFNNYEEIKNSKQSVVSGESINASNSKRTLSMYDNIFDVSTSTLSLNACNDVIRSQILCDKSDVNVEKCELFVENSSCVSEDLRLFIDRKVAQKSLSDGVRNKSLTRVYSDKENSAAEIISLENIHSNAEDSRNYDVTDIRTPLSTISLQTLAQYLPSEWDQRIDLDDFSLQDVNPRDPRILDIVDNFKRTPKFQLEIHNIQRVENPFLWLNYTLKKLEMIKLDGSCKEMTLFHGTNCTNVTSICRNNFDWKMHGTNRGHKFGKGVSFSPMASYASHYTDRRKDGFNKMFVARVLVSKTCQGKADMLVPPKGYDTSVNHERKVFVKYDYHTYYPEFIITYTGALRDLYMERMMAKKSTQQMQSTQQMIDDRFDDDRHDYFNSSQQFVMPSIQNISQLHIPHLQFQNDQPNHPIELQFKQSLSKHPLGSVSIYGPEPWQLAQQDRSSCLEAKHLTSNLQTSEMYHQYDRPFNQYDRPFLDGVPLHQRVTRSLEPQVPFVQRSTFNLHNPEANPEFLQNLDRNCYLLQNSEQNSQSLIPAPTPNFEFCKLAIRWNERNQYHEVRPYVEQNRPRVSDVQEEVSYNPQYSSRDCAPGPSRVEVTDSAPSTVPRFTSLPKRGNESNKFKRGRKRNFAHNKVQQQQNNNNNHRWQPWANESLQCKMKHRDRFLPTRRGFC